jgi:putative cardiolipin synthase
MHRARASAAADAPEKIGAAPAADLDALAAAGAEVRMRVSKAIRDAREELVIVSPYLIPGPNAEAALREFRKRGVRVTLMTNSLAATDEPLVHVGYRRYRTALLREGVELYEWSPVRSGRVFRQLLRGRTVLRLHAKCALIDSHDVYLGSMNFDPRSRNLNTEFALLIHSPELAAQVAGFVHDMKRAGSYRVRLAADGETLRWSPGDGGDDVEDFEPDTDFWSRLLLDLLSPLVPEELL